MSVLQFAICFFFVFFFNSLPFKIIRSRKNKTNFLCKLNCCSFECCFFPFFLAFLDHQRWCSKITHKILVVIHFFFLSPLFQYECLNCFFFIYSFLCLYDSVQFYVTHVIFFCFLECFLNVCWKVNYSYILKWFSTKWHLV